MHTIELANFSSTSDSPSAAVAARCSLAAASATADNDMPCTEVTHSSKTTSRASHQSCTGALAFENSVLQSAVPCSSDDERATGATACASGGLLVHRAR
eukprot:scaffold323803_cov31-Tisochrysis_lutea.AAC.1